jgi:molybdate transport system substrate-binding protein
VPIEPGSGRDGEQRSRWPDAVTIRALPVLALLLLLTRAAGADEVRVMTSGAFEAPFLALIEGFERATGHRVITVTTSMGIGPDWIPTRIRRGEEVDVAVLSDPVFAELVTEGHIAAASRTPLARSAIGMAVRAGARRPDITSVEAFTRALLQARSVAYSAQTSGVYLVTELFPRLGIAEALAAKSIRVDRGRVGTVVARGEAEIGFQQMSELLPIRGIDVVGPLPVELQRLTLYFAGVTTSARHAQAARALIAYFVSPEGRRAIADSGLEPVESR